MTPHHDDVDRWREPSGPTGITITQGPVAKYWTRWTPDLHRKHYPDFLGDERPIDLIVIHTAETLEQMATAELLARWSAGLHPTVPASEASWHLAIDADSVVQSVPFEHIAWHAGHWMTGLRSLGLEHAGLASQTPAQWADDYSEKMLRRSARVTAWLLERYEIPITWLTPEAVRNGDRGICGHVEITDAFELFKNEPKKQHRDPGPFFPRARYLDFVRGA